MSARDLSSTSDPRRSLPSVDRLLHAIAAIEMPHELKRLACRQIIAEARTRNASPSFDELVTRVRALLKDWAQPYPEVINATGVLLHTGLGRAPLPANVLEQLATWGDRYIALELDLASGRRGDRFAPLQPWLCALTETEMGLVVNNNAAAVLLALNSLANRKEVIISRGQEVEIGGSFRIPEIIRKAGARLVEIGTTNRTHLADYEAALSPRTGAILWVHPSNYRLQGFTSSVSLEQLARLARAHDIPLVADLGSGALVRPPGGFLDDEPLVAEIARQGADVITFSGDKLLGGPQAGFIVGGARWLRKMRRNQLLRALRPDKFQLFLIHQTLARYPGQGHPPAGIPFYRQLALTPAELEDRARAIATRLTNPALTAAPGPCDSTIGSGAGPEAKIPSFGLTLRHVRLSPQRLARVLRQSRPAVVGRIQNDTVILDLRTVFPPQDATLVTILNKLD